METFDIINLAITIGLGILSLGLGGFSIWLSLRFNDKSNDALDSVKDLSNELKSLMEVSLTHQKDFSSKMLDSILDQNQYGVSLDEIEKDRSLEVIENTLKAKLSETELNLSTMVEEKIKNLSNSSLPNDKTIEKTITDIKNEISNMKKTAIDLSSSFKLPKTVKEQLLEWRDFPAHYLVLACIIKEKITSIDKLEEYESSYNLPSGYQSGLQNLIDSGIINGNINKFSIPIENIDSLSIWVENNWILLEKLMKNYSNKEENTVTDYEKSLAEEFIF
ncbi:hypothetical protein [Sulfurovum sp.]|uniref:hypothetical protein n=1 Tax=Sulfurovum sp. TaxID=1969726 RepID=UPI00356576A6